MSSKPTEKDREEAKALLGPCPAILNAEECWAQKALCIAAAIAQARADEREKFAAFCDEHGEPSKVAVVHGVCWVDPIGSRWVQIPHEWMNYQKFGDVKVTLRPASDSSREAAEQARKEKP